MIDEEDQDDQIILKNIGAELRRNQKENLKKKRQKRKEERKIKIEQKVKEIQKNQEIKIQILDEEFLNTIKQIKMPLIKRNNFIFGLLMLISQLIFCIVYGIKFQTQAFFLNTGQLTDLQISLAPISINVFLAICVIIGTGLLFSYTKKLILSSLGFNLFITCFTIQLYFLVNNLIARTGILYQQEIQSNNIYLYNINNQIYSIDTAKANLHGNTFFDALKASLCNCIIFSSIAGRSGILQAFIVSVVGTFGYEFTRQIVNSIGVEYSDSNSIFTFSGFCGLIVGLILSFKLKRKQQTSTKRHPKYTGSKNSVGFSILGCCILTTTFPILALESSTKNSNIFQYAVTVAPYNIYHSAASSLLMSMAISMIWNFKIQVRDIINGCVAGSIAGFSSSFFISRPIFAQAVGSFAGMIQCIGQNLFQKRFSRNYQIITTFSFILFGIQGFIGSIGGSIFKAVVQNASTFDTTENLLTYNNRTFGIEIFSRTTPIVCSLISMGIGIAAGLIISLFLYFMPAQQKQNHFHDHTYWKDLPKVSFIEQQSEAEENEKRLQNYRPGNILQ